MTSNYKLCTLKYNVLHLSKQIEALHTSTFFEADEKAILLQIYTARLESYNLQISIIESESL